MQLLNLFLVFLMQTQPPADRVVVGLLGGREIVLENPDFSGFIQGHNGDALLTYRQDKLHGQIPVKNISRIDFTEYIKGEPFFLRLTLKDGQKLDVLSQRQPFVIVRGNSSIGVVTVKHPDPAAGVLRLTTHPTSRAKDLTIQYLEFPAP